MQIVQLANFYGTESGGIRVAIDELGRRYAAAGHRVALVIPDDRDAVSDEPMGEGHVRRVVRIKSPAVPGLGGYRMITTRSNVLAAIEALAPDVIELSDKTTLARTVAHPRLARVPAALISHERLDLVVKHTFSEWRIVGGAIAKLNRILTERADAIVCCSDFAAEEFHEHAPGAVHKIARIPLGVDLATFRPSARTPDADRGQIGTAERPLRLVAVVRLSPEKQPWVVVAAVAQLVRRGVRVEAVVYGAGPHRERLELLAEGLPITFAGHLSGRQALARAVGEADVAIAPGPLETFGLGGLEVLACGTPVVVPDSGALQELIDPVEGHRYGRVAASEDPVAFADAVIELTSGNRAERRTAARARAEQFSWDRSAADLVALYERLRRGASPFLPAAAPAYAAHALRPSTPREST